MWLRLVAGLLFLSLPVLAGEPSSSNAPLLQAVLGPGGPAGFCAQVGCGDGALTAELAGNERLAIHALEADEQNVRRARELLERRGLYGRAVVEPWTASWLPYADNLINVLVAENPGPVPETELLRVLAPLGTLWIKQNGAWQSRRKPWPKDFDEWTHWRHGADGNMVSRDTAVQTPSGVRWMAGPIQDAGVRPKYYDHVLVSAAGRNFYVYDDAIVARDAFNGRLLWRREAKAPTFKETGTAIGSKFGTRVSKVRPVAAGDRLYVALEGQLAVLDTASGRTIQNLAPFEQPREIFISEGVLCLSGGLGLRGLRLDGTPLWTHGEAARRVVSGDGRVFFVRSNQVVALDLQTGAERWRRAHPKAAETATCTYYGGVLVLERSSWSNEAAGNGIVVFSGERGELLWEKDFKPGMSHFKEARAFFAENLVWLETLTFPNPRIIKFIGYDPRTGKARSSVGTRGLHCAPPIATERYLITPEMEFTDLKTGERTRARMAKNACRLPYVPANGLLYTFPVECECFPMLRGYMGLAPNPPARRSDAPRLERGPAYGRAPGVFLTPSGNEEWPMYRHDAYRSGGSPAALNSTNLHPLWKVALASKPAGPLASEWADDPYVRGVLSAPVCASGLVVLALPDRQRVAALDANTGALRWTFTAGGRVDLPPTLCGELCVFGARDGWVYCLNLADGQLVWRFRAAPSDARIAAYGQMESPWPVAGSVLVDNGIAYVAAGRHPNAAGGVFVYALRPRDCRVLWKRVVTDMDIHRWYGGRIEDSTSRVGLDYEPVDILVRDGDCVAMSRWRFVPDTGQMTLVPRNGNYQAYTGLEVPRGIWGYGIRQAKLPAQKPPAVFNERVVLRGSTNVAALLLAGSTLFRADLRGEITAGSAAIQLDSPPVHDGLITAYGRLYAATRDGTVYCLGAR